MHLQTFRARTIQEALRLVREELGPDASVLHTREIASPMGRWLGGRLIEVTASADVEAESRFEHDATESPESSIIEARIPAADAHNYRQQILHALLVRNQNEPSLVEQLASAPRRGLELPAIAAFRKQLRSAHIGERLANRWLERLAAELACDPECHPDRAADRLRQIVASDLSIAGPIRLQPQRSTVVAFVGPTGVGKTTTVAKLAAHFRLAERRSVALVTSDTYRIAAAEQLRTYAQIMELPMEVVTTPAEMAAAVQQFSGHELVLIDTAGRSPRDSAQLQHLRAQLAAIGPDEVHLVGGAMAGHECLEVTAQAFASAGATRLVLTKLDEAGGGASIADCLAACRLPLSYTTHGQNVPHDIRPASAVDLAKAIVPFLQPAR